MESLAELSRRYDAAAAAAAPPAPPSPRPSGDGPRRADPAARGVAHSPRPWVLGPRLGGPLLAPWGQAQ
eukprot:6005840-Alexandrium_andersonii.AAC.1